MPEQQQREAPRESPWERQEAGPFNGPRVPDIQKPDTQKLLKRMKAIDSEQAKKYRQRAGE